MRSEKREERREKREERGAKREDKNVGHMEDIHRYMDLDLKDIYSGKEKVNYR